MWVASDTPIKIGSFQWEKSISLVEVFENGKTPRFGSSPILSNP